MWRVSLYIPSGAGVPDEQRTYGTMPLRYEEVDASGFLKATATPQGLGVFVFRQLWRGVELGHTLRQHGILPILSRLQGQTLQGPISAASSLEVEAWYRLGFTRDSEGAVSRLLLLCGTDLFAPKGATHDPQPEGAGERIHVGRVFAEHVFTRPFGPIAQRKVTSFDVQKPEVVLGEEYAFASAASTLQPPEGAEWLEPEFRADVAPTVFGLGHTDPNHHVNSLHYPPLFESAALRCLEAQDIATRNLRLSDFNVAYRKPCFPGDILRIHVRALKRPGQVGALAYLSPEGAYDDKAHALCALWFTSSASG